MKVFLGVAFMGLMLIANGKINLNSEKKDKAVLKNKELNLWLGYIESRIFADNDMLFGKIFLASGIVGMICYDTLGLFMVLVICITALLFFGVSMANFYKYYKGKEYKFKGSSKSINTIILVATIVVSTIGVITPLKLGKGSIVFSQIDSNEENGRTFTYEIKGLPEMKEYELGFNVKHYELDKFEKPKYQENIGTSKVYYNERMENPKVTFSIDEHDNCTIFVTSFDKNLNKIEDKYEYKFRRVDNETSDMIAGEFSVPVDSNGNIIGEDNGMNLYSSENNNETSGIRIRIK